MALMYMISHFARLCYEQPLIDSMKDTRVTQGIISSEDLDLSACYPLVWMLRMNRRNASVILQRGSLLWNMVRGCVGDFLNSQQRGNIAAS